VHRLFVGCRKAAVPTLLLKGLSPLPDSSPSLQDCHPYQTLPSLVLSFLGCLLSSHDMTSTLQFTQLPVHPATISYAPSNLSFPGLVQPCCLHCTAIASRYLHCTTAVHAILTVLLLSIPSALVQHTNTSVLIAPCNPTLYLHHYH
jgi:hypothetical protein